jgi:opacity protein-like surface antigen
MNKITILAAVAAMALATPAFAQSAIPPSDPTIQPSGGRSDPAIAAPTGNLQGSQVGMGSMNGPNGNGMTNREQARADDRGYVDATNGTLVQPNSNQINK